MFRLITGMSQISISTDLTQFFFRVVFDEHEIVTA